MITNWILAFVALVGVPGTIMGGIQTYFALRDQIRRKDAVANDRELDALNANGDDGAESVANENSESVGDLKRHRKHEVYSINGSGSFGKCRLVLEVIRQYAAQHPDVTYSELAAVFPKSLRGVKRENTFWGCINRKVDADRLLAETGRSRHFLQDDEVIGLKDGTQVAVSSQWGSGNINLFIDQARKLGFNIQAC